MKADIFSAARELFYTKGFKDTNVAEIAKLAGVGVGTFYNYYDSKEKIFLEIYIKENEDLKKSMMGSVDLNDDPVTLVTKAVSENARAMESNKILKEWYNKDLFSRLEKYFDEQNGIAGINSFIQSGTMEMIRAWKAEGKIRTDISDDMIMALFNAVPYIDLHKTEIGIQHFPQLTNYLTEFVMKGLTEGSAQAAPDTANSKGASIVHKKGIGR